MKRLIIVAASIVAVVSCSNGDDSPTQEVSSQSSAPAATSVASSTLPERKGPFGLAGGMTIEELKSVSSITNGPSAGVYQTDKVPKPHPMFETYLLLVSEKSGLCKVAAIGKDFESNSFGHSVKSNFKEIENGLTEKYGKPDHAFDQVLAGSIWDDPEDFMMGLLRNERVLKSFWGGDKKELIDGVHSIGLSANAIDMRTAYLSLQYEFSNIDDCMEEQKARMNEGL